MLIYSQERKDGLAPLLSAGRITLAADLTNAEPFLHSHRNLPLAVASQTDSDLHFFKSVLVTAGWMDSGNGVPWGLNKNDDFFDPMEVLAARATPEDKPINMEHDGANIVGHIVANEVVGPDGIISDDASEDDLPGRVDVIASSVLYKVWKKEELQKKSDQLIADLTRDEGPAYGVSMECLFRGFDYLIIDGGEAKAIARGKETAFLTKHLRAYGGKGEYQGKKVGRILRDLTFSGMGMTRKPANPNSIILANATLSHTEKSVTNPIGDVAKISTKDEILVYATGSQTHTQAGNTMEELQKQLAAEKLAREKAEKDRDAAQAKLATHEAEAKAKDEANAKALAAELDAAKKLGAEATEELKKSQASLAQVTESLATEKAAREKAEAELAETALKAKKADRLNKVKEALKVEASDAEAVAEAEKMEASLSPLADEAFDAHIQAVAKFTSAKLPPKSTPAQSAKQSTDKPAPNKAAASQAASDVLDQAQAKKEPDLNPGIVSEGSDRLRKGALDAASWFGSRSKAK